MTTIISNLKVTPLAVDKPIGIDNPPQLTPDNKQSGNVNGLTQQVLQLSDFEVDWAHRLSDSALDSLVSDGWLVLDDVFVDKALLALQAESGFIDYREAELTAGIRVSNIRGDNIRWIDRQSL